MAVHELTVFAEKRGRGGRGCDWRISHQAPGDNGAVYALRTVDGDFKMQVYDYFEHEGSDPGNIRIRREKL